jgi:general secretion pathway protein I
MKASSTQHGFTLIEVLVALAIIAIALGALISSSGSQASSATYLKQKTIAHWVAMNELTRLNVEKRFPDIGKDKGTVEMAGTQWYWSRETLETDDKAARQVSYTVYADKSRDKNLTRLTGYVLQQ